MENKRFLNELSFDELKAVFEVNKKLSDMVENDYIESEMMYISEQLDGFKNSLLKWEIGFYNQNYLKIKDSGQFIEDFRSYVNCYGLDDDDMKTYIDIITHDFDKEENKELENYYDLLDEKAEILKNILLKNFNFLTTIENAYLLEHFSTMIELNYFDDYYILDNDFSVVYRDVSYTETLE